MGEAGEEAVLQSWSCSVSCMCELDDLSPGPSSFKKSKVDSFKRAGHAFARVKASGQSSLMAVAAAAQVTASESRPVALPSSTCTKPI